MKPNDLDRTLVSSGVMAQASFGISQEDSAHIMHILRDAMYTDRILAVLREYSSNAWDANREAGRGDKPIEVTLPEYISPLLVIKDRGPGLSENDVLRVYTQYGRSTKRDSDNTVGMLGLGSKSAFAYSDSFTIISCHGGKRSTYVASLDESNVGVIQKLSEENCGTETGVEIQVTVDRKDIQSFKDTAQRLFRYFDPPPKINLKLDKITGFALPHGMVAERGDDYYGKKEWVAVMGCVPYVINVEKAREVFLESGNRLWESVLSNGGYLRFNIGEVQISASREELKYSDKTKKAIVSRFEDLFKELLQKVTEDLEKQDLPDWEKRKAAVKLVDSLKLSVPQDYRFLSTRKAELLPRGKNKEEQGQLNPQHFTVRGGGEGIQVSDRTKLVFVEDPTKDPRGYDLETHEYAVTINKDSTAEQAWEELQIFVTSAFMEGIPIEKTGNRSWHQPYFSRGWGYRMEEPAPNLPTPPPEKKARTRSKNVKHRRKFFRLLPDALYEQVRSARWETVDRAPEPTDVYVVLDQFSVITVGGGWDKDKGAAGATFYDVFKRDRELAQAFGETMPDIYGYKKSSAPAEREGSLYNAWREKWLLELAAKQKEKILDLYWNDASERIPIKVLAEMQESAEFKLGPTHKVMKLLSTISDARTSMKASGSKYESALTRLVAKMERRKKNGKEVPLPEDTTKKELKEIEEAYPLIADLDRGVIELFGADKTKRDRWLDYISLVDASRRKRNGRNTVVHNHQDVADRGLGGTALLLPVGHPQLPEPQGSDRVEAVG